MTDLDKQFPRRVLDAGGPLAEQSGPPSAIHPNDHIFWFVFNSTPDKTLAITQYFEKGAETAAWLKGLIGSHRPLDEPFSLLDFASGYGRVTRHLANVLPAARVVGCDIHPDAIAFLHALGIEAIPSSAVPEQFLPEQQFDVVLALSFFTHMPKSTWSRWLRSLLDCLVPGGVLIFTAHGEPGLQVMGRGLQQELTFDQDGFCFVPTSEQIDLNATEYGSTATAFAYVYGQLINTSAKLRCFQEGGAGYQDLYILQRQRQDRRAVYAATIATDRIIPVTVSIRHAWLETSVTNTGTDPWMNARDWIRFCFGGRLFPRIDEGRAAAPVREFRALLPSLVEPGESVPVSLVLDLVGLSAGEYVLSLDVIKEHHFWFGGLSGSGAWLGVHLAADSVTFSAARRHAGELSAPAPTGHPS